MPCDAGHSVAEQQAGASNVMCCAAMCAHTDAPQRFLHGAGNILRVLQRRCVIDAYVSGVTARVAVVEGKVLGVGSGHYRHAVLV